MQHFLQTVFSALLAPFIAVAAFFTPAPPVPQPIDPVRVEQAIESVVELQQRVSALESAPPAVGATNAVPSVVALYEDSLASKMTSTQTTMTLVRGTDKSGTLLASSTYPFIIDEGLSTEEFVLADCTGTTCTNLTRGISVLTGTTTVSGLKKEHRRGASVKITDGPQLIIISRIINGQGTFPNLLSYTSGTACSGTSGNQTICDKAYIDGVAIAGASNANDTTKGIVETATAAEAAAGTSLGGTGARLVLGANLATSTCQSAANSVLVASSTTGKLPETCFNTAYNYTFTGSNTFNTGTTTHNGPTALATSTQFGVYGGLSPVGSITAYASTTAPAGWLLANGASLLRTDYPQLFAILGTSYGAADGTHFTLPNLLGRDILMASTTANIGQTGGESNHTLSIAEMPAHSHDFTTSALAGGGGTVAVSNATVGTGSTNSTGGGGAHNVLDPYIVLQYIIKY